MPAQIYSSGRNCISHFDIQQRLDFLLYSLHYSTLFRELKTMGDNMQISLNE